MPSSRPNTVLSHLPKQLVPCLRSPSQWVMAIHPQPGQESGSQPRSQPLLPGYVDSITKTLCGGGGDCSHVLNASSFHPFSQALAIPNPSGLLLALAFDLTFPQTTHCRQPATVKFFFPCQAPDRNATLCLRTKPQPLLLTSPANQNWSPLCPPPSSCCRWLPNPTPPDT